MMRFLLFICLCVIAVDGQAMTCVQGLTRESLSAELATAHIPVSRRDNAPVMTSKIESLLQDYPQKEALKILQTLLRPRFAYFIGPGSSKPEAGGQQGWNFDLISIVNILTYAHARMNAEEAEAFFDDLAHTYSQLSPEDLSTSLALLRLIRLSIEFKTRPIEIYKVAKAMAGLTFKPGQTRRRFTQLVVKSALKVIERSLLRGRHLKDIEAKIDAYKKIDPADQPVGKLAFEAYFD